MWNRVFTSVSDVTVALLDEWAKIPTDSLQTFRETLPKGVEAVKAAKMNQIIMNVIKAPAGVVCKCPNSSVI